MESRTICDSQNCEGTYFFCVLDLHAANTKTSPSLLTVSPSHRASSSSFWMSFTEFLPVLDILLRERLRCLDLRTVCRPVASDLEDAVIYT